MDRAAVSSSGLAEHPLPIGILREHPWVQADARVAGSRLCGLPWLGWLNLGLPNLAPPCSATCLCLPRSQELHLRPESHAYLPELGKSELEFIESKRPRLELLPEPLLRPSALLATGQPGASEDLTKVRHGPTVQGRGARLMGG